jgi:glycosyltransferase involved in cell wall biosynthesis
MKKNNYSVTFVLPSPSILYPAGGYNIVYQIAHNLNGSGIKTAIIFQKDASIFIPNYKEDKSMKKNGIVIIKKGFEVLFNNRRIETFYRLRLYRFLGIDYDYSVLDNVDCYYYNGIENVNIKTDLIIATAWPTAYFVNEFVKKYKSKPFYLIQNSEDEPSFSGINSTNAEETYHFNFKKIVINRKLYTRFKNEDPLFFHVGIDTNFYKVKEDINKRGNVVLIPLRQNLSKGAKYAIECARKLLTYDSKADINILMFGDYNIKKIPEDIRDKIEYHYLPTNKQLLQLYNKAFIFVLPSLVEGMPVPPLEAMACGCAVIVTDNGGINEYMIDEINGLICPIEDAECLSKKVVYLLNNKEKREELVKNSIETTKQFSYQQMNKDFINLIKPYLEDNNVKGH